MSTEASTAAPATAAPAAESPTKPPCWPGDPDYLDGRTEIELSLKHVRAYWDADILDVDDKNKHDRIIEHDDPFEIRIRIELVGRLWRCICGNWCFKIGFTAIGPGEDFELSSVLSDPSQFEINDWKGCDRLCIEKIIRVPGGTIPTAPCGSVYEVAAWFELRCCGSCRDPDSHLAVAGFERLGEYMFA